jgi:hypothetical protein
MLARVQGSARQILKMTTVITQNGMKFLMTWLLVIQDEQQRNYGVT